MTPATYVAQSLKHYTPSHLGTLAGVMIAGAALTGALLVGDSMRASLRENALARLGPRVDYVAAAPRFFEQSLAERLKEAIPKHDDWFVEPPVAVVSLVGAVTHADTRARSSHVQLWGVGQDFWALDGMRHESVLLDPRAVILNPTLAAEIGADVGDDVLVRFRRETAISSSTLLGRREGVTESLRLKVAAIVGPDFLGDFSIQPQQAPPGNAFVPRETLQRAIDQPGKANLLIVDGPTPGPQPRRLAGIRLNSFLPKAVDLADLGLKLVTNIDQGYFALESDAMLIPPVFEHAALAAAASDHRDTAPVITYLANAIERLDARGAVAAAIPYSTVAGIPATGAPASAMKSAGSPEALAPLLNSGEIWLNEWSAGALGATLGDAVRLTYYVSRGDGELENRTSDFRLTRIVALAGAAADRGFTPEYRGITDTEDLADWDPPFPVDLKKIRPQDEDYWDQHRATPKAFVNLDDAERLWSERPDVLGRYTSIRYYDSAGAGVRALAKSIEMELLRSVEPRSAGLEFRDLRDDLARAAAGNTDFGGLFIGFSFFLIASAALLVILLFGLLIERRRAEFGLLSALGAPPKLVRRLIVEEGAVVALLGAIFGVALGIGYAWLMLMGLRTLWSAATSAPFLRLHVSLAPIVVGLTSTFLLALAAMYLSARRLRRESVRKLMSAAGAELTAPGARGGFWRTAGIALILAGLLSAIGGEAAFGSATAAFFLAGVLTLVGGLLLVRSWLRSGGFSRAPLANLAGFAARNTARNPARSTLTLSLLSSATFLIVALEAFRLQPTDMTAKNSGSGGCAIVAEAGVPLLTDLNTPAGRAALGVRDDAALAAMTRAWRFRLRPGESTSCLNLYQSQSPRVLGATPEFVARGGFSFQTSAAESSAQRENPWSLLEKPLADGAIPAIGDEASVKWQLKLGLGKELVVDDEAGRPQRLRFVALLSGSVLQGEVVVSEASFRRLFPARDGYGFFLVETAQGREADTLAALERELEPYAFDAERSAERLTRLFAVQNTYLSTFQLLGGLGLLLGAGGLAAVMLRNILERRKELALLGAVGYPLADLRRLLFRESAVLIVAGLALGAIPAFVAVLPHVRSRPQSSAWVSSLILLGLVALVGLAAGALALRGLRRSALAPALRSE